MISCDFCGQSEHQAEKVIVGHRSGTGGNVAICEKCIGQAAYMIEREKQESEDKEGEAR